MLHCSQLSSLISQWISSTQRCNIFSTLMLPPPSIWWPAVIVHLGTPPSPWNYAPRSGKDVKPRDVGSISTGLTIHKEIKNSVKHKTSHLVSKAKSTFYSFKVSTSSTVKELYRLTNNLLGKITSTPLPSVYSTDQLPQFCFFWFFLVSNVQQIRDSIDRQVVHSPSHSLSERRFSGTPLCGFETVTQETVLKCMKQMTPKTCVLVPTVWMLWPSCSSAHYHCKSVFETSRRKTPFENQPQQQNTHLTQICLKTSSLFPICPRRQNSLRNLFLTNCSVISTQWSLAHLPISLLPKTQYRDSSLRALNDLLIASDSGSISILTLPDLSAALDTIGHSILLTRLENIFGIRDLALSFFRSYLQGRTQVTDLWGAPGFRLETNSLHLYTQPLSDVIRHHSVSHHMFADDTELYKSDSSSEAFTLSRTIEAVSYTHLTLPTRRTV